MNAKQPVPRATPNAHAPHVDAAALARALRGRVDGEVRFADADRALYATDAGNYRQVPIGVVVPRSVEALTEAVSTAREFDAPVLPRGCGTSLAGQCCNVAVVIDCSKYLHRVLEVDAAKRVARVEPGTILDDLRSAARPHGLTFGPDPATHNRCTIGGMIGNDSCGVHSVLAEFYGPGPRTEHSVRQLDVLTYDGTHARVGADGSGLLDTASGRDIDAGLRRLSARYAPLIRERFPNILRRVSGYNLPALLPENGVDVARALCGSEGTCVTILEATVQLIPALAERVLVVMGFDSVYDAADRVPDVRRFKPVGLEGMDDRLIEFIRRKGGHDDDLRLLPHGKGWLLVEMGSAEHNEALARAKALVSAMQTGSGAPQVRILEDPNEQTRLWRVREGALGATAFVPGQPDAWPGWEDSAVPVERLGSYLRQLRSLMQRYGYDPALYGHFGQGCVHCRVDFDLASLGGIATYRAFVRDAAELVTRLGGSLSGEHGDGQARGELLPIMYGDELVEAFRQFKAIWDPAGRMNPGKVVNAHPLDRDLRLPLASKRRTLPTRFQYPADNHSLEHATLRCVGVGACRRLDGGTMCPSFMVLREEKHSTRGRAHLLFEMLQGTTVRDGWKSEAVKESLDLCLSCKGCKGDCPVNVDVATYRAEFLSHYYKGRLRPRAAYAFGLIDRWASLASQAPSLANFLTQSAALAPMAKAVAGMASERRIPRFAAQSFMRQWRRAPNEAPSSRPSVLLWIDTFNNYFYPETLRAAVAVLEDAGQRVIIPARRICCGRPLYDYGMLTRARRALERILARFAVIIDAGIPVVVLEPSCASVFRDELCSFFPNDSRAQRLSQQTFTLSEFLTRSETAYEPPRFNAAALLHGHCHQKALKGFESEQDLLRRMGVQVQTPAAGCCGMAGAFGFERDKYELSQAVGERDLLPAVRAADGDTLIVADGFSCREQIAQGTRRRALHLADVMALALERRPHDTHSASGGNVRHTSIRRKP